MGFIRRFGGRGGRSRTVTFLGKLTLLKHSTNSIEEAAKVYARVRRKGIIIELADRKKMRSEDPIKGGICKVDLTLLKKSQSLETRKTEMNNISDTEKATCLAHPEKKVREIDKDSKLTPKKVRKHFPKS